jgi:hypothetical protein
MQIFILILANHNIVHHIKQPNLGTLLKSATRLGIKMDPHG